MNSSTVTNITIPVPFIERPASERKKEIQRLIQKHPGRVPMYIECDKRCKNKPKNEDAFNKKFLVPDELSVSQLVYVIRKRFEMKPEQAIYIFFNNQMVSSSKTVREVYDLYKNKEDDMLYALYATEATFGYSDIRV